MHRRLPVRTALYPREIVPFIVIGARILNLNKLIWIIGYVKCLALCLWPTYLIDQILSWKTNNLCYSQQSSCLWNAMPFMACPLAHRHSLYWTRCTQVIFCAFVKIYECTSVSFGSVPMSITDWKYDHNSHLLTRANFSTFILDVCILLRV
jgi:hypothetical protein